MMRIAISPRLTPGQRRMFDALQTLLDVQFVERQEDAGEKVDASVHLNVRADRLSLLSASDAPCYFTLHPDDLVACGRAETVTFSRHVPTAPVLMGRGIDSPDVELLKGLPALPVHTHVLATKAQSPVWAVSSARGPAHHYVAAAVPELAVGEPLRRHIQATSFLALVPLLTFVRGLDRACWAPPPLRACFMFDDPNLHWSTYGFIDFPEIAQRARAEKYHVCFATIPLDTWFVHPSARDVFLAYSDAVSLLIHGNDHIRAELARVASKRQREAVLEQALLRIQDFERVTRLRVARVIAPPHGACSQEFLEEMPALGYEAVCVSTGSLMHYNPGIAARGVLGVSPSDMVAGTPILPRFRLSASCHKEILTAALLHQPIIAVGHHRDVSEGLQLLSVLSRFIDSLGDVVWGDMASISRAGYSHRIESATLHVKLHSRVVDVAVPIGVRSMVVHPPQGEWLEMQRVRVRDESGQVAEYRFHAPIEVRPGRRMISALPPRRLVQQSPERHRLKLWPALRRVATEGRDRLVPAFGRLGS